MADFKRHLQLGAVLKRRSAFLFDARGVGKTTLIEAQLAQATIYDFLDQRVYLRLHCEELRALVAYRRIHAPLQYWRTRSGYEVDFIVGDRVAIEVKSTKYVTAKHLRGLKMLREEVGSGLASFIVISLDAKERLLEGVRIVPWEQALQELWSAKWD